MTVVAAVIEKDGAYLIAQRSSPAELAFKWEFPGGKVEPLETPQEALKRELQEEFGVTIDVGTLIVRTTYTYHYKTVHLFAYSATHVAGEFRLMAHNSMAWEKPASFGNYDFVPADIPIVTFLIGNNDGYHA